MPLEITKLSHALGAEVRGLNLSEPLDDDTVAVIRRTWVENLVLCFPDQSLSPQQQIAFCSRFGPLDDHRNRPLWNRPDFPEVNIVSNKPQTIGGKKLMTLVADKWHTDMSFANRPATASWLHALQLPTIGGDTMFANMYRAYDALSPNMRKLAEQLQGVHDVSGAPDFQRYTPEVQAERRRNYPPVVHPVVRTHPESGRKGLFVGGFLKHFVCYTERESRPLIDFFNEFSTGPEFVYRHKWKQQDLLMWDNRCTMHFAVQDYDTSELRVLQRCTLFAPVTGHYYDPEEPDGIRKTERSRNAMQVSEAVPTRGSARARSIPLAGPIGVEITGIDIAASPSESDYELLRVALHQHSVLVLRNQDISPEQQKVFAARFGELRVSFYNRYGVADVPALSIVSNIRRDDGEHIGIADAGMLWHTDGSYLKTPDMYTVLYGIQIPQQDGKVLGDTVFTSAWAAYDALPEDMKRRVDGLRAVHSFVAHMEKKQAKGQLKRAPLTAEQTNALPDVDHPVVRRHPVNGRKCLFVTEGHTSRILGLPDSEAAELLEFLTEHVKKPEFHYRHTWRKGDLIVWDNCAVQHLAVFDYGDIPRRLHRAGIAGPVPA